ncbi:hypothetical protein MPLDJ20_320103 [Mesorhizobium plurifarium]|uniref:Uncharacterized protein n=1 Tax=Mesorhizobium plurifarium TaxID=69974 RepID=A0A090FI36_MESPL|nr:hypothetical protein MPLDJ20_320103 [Mesorhizobium plurifarium]
MQRTGKGATLRSILLDHQSLQLRKSPARSLLAILEPRLPLPRGMRGSPVAAGGSQHCPLLVGTGACAPHSMSGG